MPEPRRAEALQPRPLGLFLTDFFRYAAKCTAAIKEAEKNQAHFERKGDSTAARLWEQGLGLALREKIFIESLTQNSGPSTLLSSCANVYAALPETEHMFFFHQNEANRTVKLRGYPAPALPWDITLGGHMGCVYSVPALQKHFSAEAHPDLQRALARFGGQQNAFILAAKPIHLPKDFLSEISSGRVVAYA